MIITRLFILALLAVFAASESASAATIQARCQMHFSECLTSDNCGEETLERNHVTTIFADVDDGTFSLSQGGAKLKGQRTGDDAWQFQADGRGFMSTWTITYTFSPSRLTLNEKADSVFGTAIEATNTYDGDCQNI